MYALKCFCFEGRFTSFLVFLFTVQTFTNTETSTKRPARSSWLLWKTVWSPAPKLCPTLWPTLSCTWLACVTAVSKFRFIYWIILTSVKKLNSTDFLLVRLSSLSCIYLTCFSINSNNKTTAYLDNNFLPTERWIYLGSMSKDNRHDGRRRGAGQHRLGPRVSQGGDGRERSGSNSSGSSHGGGKSKNSPISALKVRSDLLARC